MKSIITKFIILALAVVGLGSCLSTPSYAVDICSQDVSAEVKAAAGCGGSVNKLEDAIKGILNGIIAVLGIIAVIFIIVGGITYMTSSGDPGKVKKAKDTILYAAIGLIICVLAAAIVNFTLGIIDGSSSSPDDTTQEEEVDG